MIDNENSNKTQHEQTHRNKTIKERNVADNSTFKFNWTTTTKQIRKVATYNTIEHINQNTIE